MQAVVFSFTRKGAALSLKLQTYLAVHGFATEIKTMSNFADLSPLLQIIAPNVKNTFAKPNDANLMEESTVVSAPLLINGISANNILAAP